MNKIPRYSKHINAYCACFRGRNRESVLRLVDSSYPHEKALANFTRLTKKIYNVHSLLKLPTLHNKDNLKK